MLGDDRMDYGPYISYLHFASRESSGHFDEPYLLLTLAHEHLDVIFDEWRERGGEARELMERVLRYVGLTPL